MSLTVLDPGLASRLVDLGRPGTRSLGVSVGGAADRTSFILANALVGNPPDAAGLEVCLKGPVLRADVALGCVLFGATFQFSGGRRELVPGKTFNLQPGEEIHIGAATKGLRAYLCVCGGLRTPLILGSRSGLENVLAGAVLPCESSSVPQRFVPEIARHFEAITTLHVVAGLQASWFAEGEFYEQEFVVTPALDRMGIRIQGKPLAVPERELVSEPVSPGAVQVTRDGQCIILGIDGQTIGGYPKIAQIIQADMDKLGQLRPGNRVRFTSVTLDEALARYRAGEAYLREWTTRLCVSLAGW